MTNNTRLTLSEQLGAFVPILFDGTAWNHAKRLHDNDADKIRALTMTRFLTIGRQQYDDAAFRMSFTELRQNAYEELADLLFYVSVLHAKCTAPRTDATET